MEEAIDVLKDLEPQRDMRESPTAYDQEVPVESLTTRADQPTINNVLAVRKMLGLSDCSPAEIERLRMTILRYLLRRRTTGINIYDSSSSPQERRILQHLLRRRIIDTSVYVRVTVDLQSLAMEITGRSGTISSP
jgi:hypothetical protein